MKIALALSILVLASNAHAFSRGAFMPVSDKHMIQGDVTIAEQNGKPYLFLQSDFRVTPGPDLRVVLRDSKGRNPMIIVAPLQATEGSQYYDLPVSADMLPMYDQVVIYCAKFHVDFGVAAIEDLGPYPYSVERPLDCGAGEHQESYLGSCIPDTNATGG